jgi:small-conductance mechanosensitive channel
MKIHLPKIISDIAYPFMFVIGCFALYHVLFYFMKKWARHKDRVVPGLLNKYLYYPGLAVMFVSGLWIGILAIKSHLTTREFVLIRHAVIILMIFSAGFLVMRVLTFFIEIALHHYSNNEPENYRHRKAKTKFQLIQKVCNSLIVLTIIALTLMTFESIRQIGATLLASAGVVGLVIGFAAQKSIGAMFAGLQIAIAQPIRIDDVVIVENQYGVISEISLTFVVINSWDGRRLVVPISYFLEKPFENWTRNSPELIGKVKIHADYSLPVEELRTQVKQWLEESTLWDKRTWGMVITSANEKTIEIRATMSARDSGDAFELECMIREKMINYIRQNYPDALPKSRIELASNTLTK